MVKQPLGASALKDGNEGIEGAICSGHDEEDPESIDLPPLCQTAQEE